MSKFENDYIEKAFSHFSSEKHRTIIVLIGLETKKFIPQLHSRLGKISTLQSIIWCFKNADTAVDAVAKKHKVESEDDAVTKWIKINAPEHIMYKEGNKILGRTCDMLILQDFEALTPNLTATCMETVRGGGLIVLLLDQNKSLSQLISKRSDIHEGLGNKIDFIFNKRLFKSLSQTDCTIFCDSKMRIMETTKHFLPSLTSNNSNNNSNNNLNVKSSNNFNDNSNNIKFDDEINPLLALCKTVDQKNVVESCMEIINKNDPVLVSITASRGRGKSAALGLSVAHAIEKGISSIFISALFLENIQTLFDLIILGLQNIGFKKSVDFKITYNFSGKKRSIARIDFLKTRQFISYFHPFNELKIHPGILIIDEAASIPPNYIESLLHVKLVFMASTVGGYEGTGQAFKIKFMDSLKTKRGNIINKLDSFGIENRELHNLSLNEPIRYGKNDPVEAWLNKALLLDLQTPAFKESPLPGDCELYCLNKSVLFSGSKETENILRDLFSIFTSSHYKNSQMIYKF